MKRKWEANIETQKVTLARPPPSEELGSRSKEEENMKRRKTFSSSFGLISFSQAPNSKSDGQGNQQSKKRPPQAIEESPTPFGC